MPRRIKSDDGELWNWATDGVVLGTGHYTSMYTGAVNPKIKEIKIVGFVRQKDSKKNVETAGETKRSVI